VHQLRAAREYDLDRSDVQYELDYLNAKYDDCYYYCQLGRVGDNINFHFYVNRHDGSNSELVIYADQHIHFNRNDFTADVDYWHNYNHCTINRHNADDDQQLRHFKPMDGFLHERRLAGGVDYQLEDRHVGGAMAYHW
ncbi:hypothetical protein PC120_g23765, partial [Phytophthora cactorum]